MTERFDPTAWISQSEAARIRGVSRQSISHLIRRDRLKTLVIAGKTLIRRSDIEKFKRHKPGPKIQAKSKKRGG